MHNHTTQILSSLWHARSKPRQATDAIRVHRRKAISNHTACGSALQASVHPSWLTQRNRRL